jgi:kumamolisin
MADRVELPGSRHAVPHDVQAVGRAPGDEALTVSVYLKDRSADAATAHAEGTAPPRQSREALRRARNADHADDIEALRRFAGDHGLQLTHTDPARRLVQLSGSTSAIEQAFGTELHHYQVGGRLCRGRTGALHVPRDVADRVDAVLGLDTIPFATPKIVPHKSGPPPEGFLPTEVAALYGFGDLDASGQCIALIELGGGYSDADNQAAFEAMQLALPEIVTVPVDGADNAPGDPDGADGEVALDIQIAGGTAPGAKIAVYFAPNTSQGFVDAVTQALHDEDNAPSVLSISWGAPESGWSGQSLTAMNSALKDAAALGVTVTAASGDALATDGENDGQPHVDYPASNPYVLGCGGTRIAASASTITSEVVWNSNGGGTGGGVSTLFALPAYQQGANVPAPESSAGGRGVPDVAGNADPDTGYRVIVDGQTGIVGGTSAVAPLWAGIVAGCNAGRSDPLGYFHGTLYDNATALNDISSGDNRSDGIGFAAAAGWDACTGLGSPTERLRQLLNPAAETSAS